MARVKRKRKRRVLWLRYHPKLRKWFTGPGDAWDLANGWGKRTIARAFTTAEKNSYCYLLGGVFPTWARK